MCKKLLKAGLIKPAIVLQMTHSFNDIYLLTSNLVKLCYRDRCIDATKIGNAMPAIAATVIDQIVLSYRLVYQALVTDLTAIVITILVC